MKSWRCLALVAAALAPVGACEEDDITAPPVIASIDLSIGDCAGLRVDETCQLSVVVRGMDGERITRIGLELEPRKRGSPS